MRGNGALGDRGYFCCAVAAWEGSFGAEFTLVCNDEGKLLELPPNRMLWGGADYLAGSGFIAGTDSEGNMTSLTAEEIAYYTEKYRAFLIAL